MRGVFLGSIVYIFSCYSSLYSTVPLNGCDSDTNQSFLGYAVETYIDEQNFIIQYNDADEIIDIWKPVWPGAKIIGMGRFLLSGTKVDLPHLNRIPIMESKEGDNFYDSADFSKISRGKGPSDAKEQSKQNTLPCFTFITDIKIAAQNQKIAHIIAILKRKKALEEFKKYPDLIHYLAIELFEIYKKKKDKHAYIFLKRVCSLFDQQGISFKKIFGQWRRSKR